MWKGQALEEKFRATNEAFEAEFSPTKPRKRRQTRWDFSGLNRENEYLMRMARKAFDPSNTFVQYREFKSDLQPVIVPAISEPHRIQISRGMISSQAAERSSYASRDRGHYSGSGNTSRSGSRSSRPRSAMTRSSESVLDATLEKFVDEIEEFRKW